MSAREFLEAVVAGTVDVADNTFRQLARWLLAHTEITAVATIGRDDIEDFKVWLANQPGVKSQRLSTNTQRQRLRMLRVFREVQDPDIKRILIELAEQIVKHQTTPPEAG